MLSLSARIKNNENGVTFLDGPSAIAIENNYLYVASSQSDSVTIFNIIDPLNPVQVATIRDGIGGFNYLDYLASIAKQVDNFF